MRWRVTAAPLTAGLAAVTVLMLAACTTSEQGNAVAARAIQTQSSEQQSTPSRPSATRPSPARPSTTPGDCSFKTEPENPAPPGKDVGLPPADAAATSSAKTVVLTTSQGDIPIALSARTPCTVRSFVHLTNKKFFDGTKCHRLVTAEGLKVLQCGDPTGIGIGGPGYTIPDENPTDLARSPASATHSLYPRGTIAMANTGEPHSGGSQFFIVYADSTLTPTYAVLGTIDATGLATVDKIAAGGVNPNAPGNSTPEDGEPMVPVTISATVVGS